jgi:N-acetylglucosaminyl-diphospho-decaprenol L-rhamnosyltransferase
MVTASIVSHGHGAMVADLVADLRRYDEVKKIVVTLNIPEEWSFPEDARVVIRRNAEPHGYGRNQNQALHGVDTPFLCVLNPDVRLRQNPFPALLDAMKDRRVAACAPVVTTPDGRQEDSAREFPTLLALLGKSLGWHDGTYATSVEARNPDWLAGMFLLVRAAAWLEVGGFDERYYLYYEDVDLCWRLRRRGYALCQVQDISAVHNARRASRRDWDHARWHLASMARFLTRSARG